VAVARRHKPQRCRSAATSLTPIAWA
jgi:hypothetical protein